jgi:hypothetical protein
MPSRATTLLDAAGGLPEASDQRHRAKPCGHIESGNDGDARPLVSNDAEPLDPEEWEVPDQQPETKAGLIDPYRAAHGSLRSQRRALVVALCALALLVAAGCSPPSKRRVDDKPAARRCDVTALADFQHRDLAVLLMTVSPQSTLLGVDVRTGTVRVSCPIPKPWEETSPSGLPMLVGGVAYLPTAVSDAPYGMLWFSPGFRWAAGPHQPLVDLRTGVVVKSRPSGDVMAVARDRALVHQGRSVWCTMALPPRGTECAHLPGQRGPGSYVLDEAGRPVWVPAEAVPIQLGNFRGLVVTDGSRVYRGEYYPPHGPSVYPMQVTATGQAVYSKTDPEDGSLLTQYDWFTVNGIRSGVIQTTRHRSTAPEQELYARLGGPIDSGYVIAGGRAMVIGVTKFYAPNAVRMEFSMIIDRSRRLIDLTAETGVACPETECRILAWPDVIPPTGPDSD